MDRIRRYLRRGSTPVYERLNGDGAIEGQAWKDDTQPEAFSWFTYSVFLLLGISMLWAWNMFIAATSYFQRRFEGNEWAQQNFLPMITSLSTITNLSSVFILAKLQSKASYPKRIVSSLLISIICFSLLTLSTSLYKNVGVEKYLAFVLFMDFFSSLATGFSQNGVFAYASGFGRKYTQVAVTGQSVAGVLPCIVQITSVLSVSAKAKAERGSIDHEDNSEAGSMYFLASTLLSVVTLVVFLYYFVVRRHHSWNKISPITPTYDAASEEVEVVETDSVGIWTLFRKLRSLALALATSLAVSMAFPVFTKSIFSVRPPESSSPIFQQGSFIPLGLLFWNTGDLLGRLFTASPRLTLTSRPRILFVLSLLRVLFIPLYLLCNLHGRGAIVNSDFFYLVLVQLGFGLTNGWLCSCCMLGAADYVDAHEKEAAGGFMGLVAVIGLTIGSFLSFGLSTVLSRFGLSS